MNVDLVRSIDKWVGIPACFLLSAVERLARTFRKKAGPARRNAPKRVLFIELSEMGSAILAYPAMRYVSEALSATESFFLTFSQNRFSVEVLDIIPPERILTIDIDHPLTFLRSTVKALGKIRGAGVDTVFDLELFSRLSALLSGLSGASRKVGFGKYHEEGLYRGNLMTHKVLYNCHQHMAKNFMALVKAIEREDEYPRVKEVIDEVEMTRPSYRSSQGALEGLRARLAAVRPEVLETTHMILLNPSAGRLLPIRAWPVTHYVELARRALERFDTAVVIIGLAEAHKEASEICGRLDSNRCLDFTGKTSFRDLMDLFCLADVLVTADSGPAHFAALTPAKRLVLFGPETPLLYRPFGSDTQSFWAGLSCSPCLSAYNHRKTSCKNAVCMQAIRVDEVFEALSRALDNGGEEK